MSEQESQGNCSKHGPSTVCGHTDATCPDSKNSVDSTVSFDFAPVREMVESKYFIQKPTLEGTLDRLKEIEPSKRKIILFVGVHPNEGTDTLTARYADQWAEKYGATIVCQPTEETPHALWAKHGAQTGGDASVPLTKDATLDEVGNASKFTLGSNDTFIVRLHGTPLSWAKGRTKPGLEIITSRFAQHPEEFNDRPHVTQYNHPHIVQGLEGVLAASNSEDVQNVVHEEGWREESKFNENTPDRLLIEYFYDDKPVEIKDKYIRELLQRETEATKAGTVFPLSEENWQQQLKMGIEYIEQPTLSEKGIADFHSTVVNDLKKILEYISKQLPE